jgi:mono/diheme cytochrome c family protein
MAVVALGHGTALAQTGDAAAGKAMWEGPTTQCRNCHGANGEGAFGPDLAGRKMTLAQFVHAVRRPWGVMPAYVDSQVTDAELANMAAYFDSLPVNKAPGKWRFEVPPNAARGQMVALNVGCAQCHGPILNGPRAGMGAVDGDFEDFKHEVYDHTTVHPKHRALIGEPMPPRLRMGNFSPTRMWESQLREIYDWARKDLGFRVLITGRLRKGEAAANGGVTYRLNVENLGLKDKAKTAEDVTISLVVPAGVDVIATTGEGYQGVQAEQKASVAVWKLARVAPKDHLAFTITLSKAATAADNLRGTIRWTKPAVSTGPFDQANIGPAPL